MWGNRTGYVRIERLRNAWADNTYQSMGKGANELFECPGFRIVRQYKNDGEEENDLPIHCY